MNNYLDLLISKLEPHADANNARPMEKYLRDLFPHLGIKKPERTRLLKEFVNEHGHPDITQIEPIVRRLWELPHREYQYVALSFLERVQKNLSNNDIELLEFLIVNKSWWDTVDIIAAKLVGTVFKNYPSLIKIYTPEWVHSDNTWLQRSALLFQLKYKQDTDTDLLYSYIDKLKTSKEFFIQKAIGWILREYSKTNPQSVLQYIESTQLASLSRREALKYMKKKGITNINNR